MKLLIADDNPEIRALARQLCAGPAHEVRDCCNGAEAVALFEELQPDLTVMDLMMPEVDGLTATAQVKARNPKARVVIITELRSPEYREAAKAGDRQGQGGSQRGSSSHFETLRAFGVHALACPDAPKHAKAWTPNALIRSK